MSAMFTCFPHVVKAVNTTGKQGRSPTYRSGLRHQYSISTDFSLVALSSASFAVVKNSSTVHIWLTMKSRYFPWQRARWSRTLDRWVERICTRLFCAFSSTCTSGDLYKCHNMHDIISVSDRLGEFHFRWPRRKIQNWSGTKASLSQDRNQEEDPEGLPPSTVLPLKHWCRSSLRKYHLVRSPHISW